MPADEFATSGRGAQLTVNVESTTFTTLRILDAILVAPGVSANRVAQITLQADGTTHTVECRITDEAYAAQGTP